MMAAFNVSDIDLTKFGYPDSVSFFPMLTLLFIAKLKFLSGQLWRPNARTFPC